MNSKNRFILKLLLTIEFVLLNLVLILFLYFRLDEFSFSDPVFLKTLIPLIVIYNLCWLFIILYIRDKEFYFNPEYSSLRSILTSLFFFVGLVISFVILFQFRNFARSNFIIPIFIFSFLDFLSHKFLLNFLKKKGSKLITNTLLIISAQEVNKLNGFVKDMAQYGYNVVGCLEDGDEITGNNKKLKVLGHIEDLSQVLNKNTVEEIFIATANLERSKIRDTITLADNFGVRVKLIPEHPKEFTHNYKAITFGDVAAFKLRKSPLDSFNATIIKRLFDFWFALTIILLCSPIYLFIGILIFLDSRGPIIYAPYRKGEAGKTFRCYKFRTMSVCDNPLDGTKSTEINDPRITRVGRLLRKSDLDELPQFFNVLKGEMSVIGPRPHRVNLQKDFRKSVSDYMVRSYVKPGITGWAQVNGWRGPTVTDEQKKERIKHDLWYIENWSFWLDIKIIFLTLFGRHHQKAF
ncbi:exopolysaccharide biosynthesis polyprenyl glycosylphosphotransferase [Muriicola sp. Z0-33]|uniref:exopolysaccharide biosynthesis polyprenyl glycosylphosphotransferase n=1 Tax=Muriicola sp. Z0-33 TaxID=2816957 RepID=UPI002238B33C|nr:exopolysaccharide biosynthesis polyprenyl glycosylphosphotransferase [Muriicola sp. Z0-33]MCW5515674.1 exopolysaccharide biosynthesis polyprenyl glycosylphosphotransferase [Muriicola sp. Z0-33]